MTITYADTLVAGRTLARRLRYRHLGPFARRMARIGLIQARLAKINDIIRGI